MKHLKEFENNLIEKDLLNILDEELYTEDYYEGVSYISNDGKKKRNYENNKIFK